jgi:hypothetical protein
VNLRDLHCGRVWVSQAQKIFCVVPDVPFFPWNSNQIIDMPPKRQRATDFFSPEPTSEDRGITEENNVRRSTRLHPSQIVEVVIHSKRRKPSIEPDTVPKNGNPKVGNETPASRRGEKRQISCGSQSTDDNFVDAREFNTPDVSGVDQEARESAVKSTPGEDSFVPAVNDRDTISKKSTSRPSTRGSDQIPSSQPRPRTERTPIPLQVRSASPLPSLPPSTSISEANATQNSITVLLASQSPISEQELESDPDSDNEAPEAISLSQSRSQALKAQSQLDQAAKVQAEKAREKRRKRAELLASQKEAKNQRSLAVEIPPSNSNVSAAEVSTANSTASLDVPAPNQDHQAARIARKAEALPTSILQAASETWFDTPSEEKKSTKKRSKKRKKEDDGIRILSQTKPHLPPKSTSIALRKEEMIMRMGRGERKMYIGRFAR